MPETTDATEQDVYTVRVDEDVCVGAGQCVFVAPEIFSQREDDGVVILLEEHPSPDQVPLVEEAVEVCPARVIALSRGKQS